MESAKLGKTVPLIVTSQFFAGRGRGLGRRGGGERTGEEREEGGERRARESGEGDI